MSLHGLNASFWRTSCGGMTDSKQRREFSCIFFVGSALIWNFVNAIITLNHVCTMCECANMHAVGVRVRVYTTEQQLS